MGKDVRHALARTSWWSGRGFAVCGTTFEYGAYYTRWFGSVDCPKCKRLLKQQKEDRKR